MAPLDERDARSGRRSLTRDHVLKTPNRVNASLRSRDSERINHQGKRTKEKVREGSEW